MSRRHRLKCWPMYYEEIRTERKPFEVRKDDRGYEVGDILELNEWDPETQEFTGRELFRRVTYILRDSPLFPLSDVVVMGIERADAKLRSAAEKRVTTAARALYGDMQRMIDALDAIGGA